MRLCSPRLLIVASLCVLTAACGSDAGADIETRLDGLEQRIVELERDDQVARSLQGSSDRTDGTLPGEAPPDVGEELDDSEPGSEQPAAASEAAVDLADAVFLAFADSAALEGPSDEDQGIEVRGSEDEVTIALAGPSDDERAVIESLLLSLGFADDAAKRLAVRDVSVGSEAAGDLEAFWRDEDSVEILVIRRI